MRGVISALVSGLIFGIGLTVSGMTNPAKVLGFLDLAGDWDPSLAFVMAGGAITALVGFRLVGRRAQPLFARDFPAPAGTAVDGRLIGGAAVFGLGWGLIGLCPGPAITALVLAPLPAALFVGGMIVGMLAWGRFGRRSAEQAG
jgi:uncharacterized membrane protein YedE/YeeE